LASLTTSQHRLVAAVHPGGRRVRRGQLRVGRGFPAITNALERADLQCENQRYRELVGDVSAAARRLGVERTTLHKRMRALGLAWGKSDRPRKP
jgi:transcriptional regulator of acetoin/glycerol metabolism